jgi:hypothetical protein
MALIINSFGEFVDDFDPYAPLGQLARTPTGTPTGEERPAKRHMFRLTCERCQRNFWSRDPNARHCSEACRSVAESVKKNGDGSYTGICAMCGRPWRAYSPRRVYCSGKCKAAAARERERRAR